MTTSKVYEGRARIELINGDCMEGMAAMKNKQFDLAIVDPPYGLDVGNMTMGKGSRNDTGKNQRKNWDKKIPKGKYFSLIKTCSINQIIWGGNYFGNHLGKCKGPIIWDKKDFNSNFADGEMAWSSINKVLKIYQRSRSSNGDSKNKIHPTQKPVALYKWILKNYAKGGNSILDTHGGSMSLAIACWDLGFDLTCFEIDKDYYTAAVKRFENHIKQKQLF